MLLYRCSPGRDFAGKLRRIDRLYGIYIGKYFIDLIALQLADKMERDRDPPAVEFFRQDTAYSCRFLRPVFAYHGHARIHSSHNFPNIARFYRRQEPDSAFRPAGLLLSGRNSVEYPADVIYDLTPAFSRDITVRQVFAVHVCGHSIYLTASRRLSSALILPALSSKGDDCANRTAGAKCLTLTKKTEKAAARQQ